jgi:hypothetical protein
MTGREAARRVLTEHFKCKDSPWKNEAKWGFRDFCPENEDMMQPAAAERIRFAESLFSKLEGAAAHVGCELRGLWRFGIHFIPGHELVRTLSPEGFLLIEANGGFSPIIVGHEEILLQCGEHPFVFRYTIKTDFNPIFENAVIAGSFF